MMVLTLGWRSRPVPVGAGAQWAGPHQSFLVRPEGSEGVGDPAMGSGPDRPLPAPLVHRRAPGCVVSPAVL